MNSFLRTKPGDYYNMIMLRLSEWEIFVVSRCDDIQPLKRTFFDNLMFGPAEQVLDVRLKNTQERIINYGPKVIVDNYTRLLMLTKLLDECIVKNENIYLSCDDLWLISTPVSSWAK